jgi:hypothetical protein
LAKTPGTIITASFLCSFISWGAHSTLLPSLTYVDFDLGYSEIQLHSPGLRPAVLASLAGIRNISNTLNLMSFRWNPA